jgi:hypothetical protein
MTDHRLFVSQETLDVWMTEEHVSVDGEILTLSGGQRFQLKTALHFLEEVAGGGDDAQLIGKVKDLDQLGELGGEHCADSVILDESAYQVVEGFLGEPIFDGEPPTQVAGNEAIGRITRFFLGQR